MRTKMNFIFFIVLSMSSLANADIVYPPSDVRVLIRNNRATIYWTTEGDLKSIVQFEITYEIVDSPFGTLRVTRGIHGYKRSFKLAGLLPAQTYRLFMVTVGTGGVSNSSDILEFTTSSSESVEFLKHRRFSLYSEEIVIILIVVVMWACAVVLFMKQWGNIRILQPMEPRFKHNPKNLEHIRIVKRVQDSVIYKSYNRKLSITMVEREKRRVQRMNTVPTMDKASLSRVMTLPTIKMEEMKPEI